MLLTICTIRQLPQAFTLAESFRTAAGNSAPEPVIIGLADDENHLPPHFKSTYPLLPIGDILPAQQLASLSTQYTSVEFTAACKPLFIAEVFRRFPDANRLLYADPNTQFVSSLTPVWDQLNRANLLITPFITRHPAANTEERNAWPDEKFFQNIGLYSADFMAFRRSEETDRMLAWWDDRVRERAYLNYCEGLCLDQSWLMHVPVFFRDVVVVKNPGWHLALWNLPERTLRATGTSWLASGPVGENQPLLFVNFKGLFNPNEGFFPHQNRVRIGNYPAVSALLADYRLRVARHQLPAFRHVIPAYGQQPEPPVLRGWRYTTVQSLKAINRLIDRVNLPELR